MKKKFIILVLVVVALLVWGFRVYQVNAGVAETYKIKTYQVGDKIPFDNAVFQVKKVSYGKIKNNNDHGFNSLPVKVKMVVRNTSKQSISVAKIIESKLAYGLDSYVTNEGQFEVGSIKNLPPNTSTTITMLYHVRPTEKGKKPKLYLDQSLYKKRVIQAAKKEKRFGIAVQL